MRRNAIYFGIPALSVVGVSALDKGGCKGNCLSCYSCFLVAGAVGTTLLLGYLEKGAAARSTRAAPPRGSP